VVTTYYLDASVALRVLFGHSESAAAWLDGVNASPESSVVSSRILRTEITRVLRRESVPVSLRDRLLDYVGTVPISDAVLAEAEAIVPHLKALDAIHLASVITTGIDAVIVTHDKTMKAVADLIGYTTFDPITDN
jgi:predicted nucleic acid-binding protein